MRDTDLTKSPNFVNLGLSSIHTSDELWSVFILTTRIGTPADGSNLLPPGHFIGEFTQDKVIRTGSDQDYNAKTNFGSMRVNQYFGRQSNPLSQPPLDLNPLGTNTTNGKFLPMD